MAEIINLRRLRKANQRLEADKQADANRQKYGQSKAEKKLASAEKIRAAKQFDGHKRED